MSNLNDIFFTPAANQELTYDQVLEDVQRYFAENHASTIAEAGEGNAARATSLLKELMEHYIVKRKYALDGLSTKELCSKLYEDMAGYSFLKKWIYKPGVEEVNINAYNDIEVIESSGRSIKIPDKFSSPQHAIDVIRRMLNACGMVIDDTMPSIVGFLDKNIRISVDKTPIVDADVGVNASIRIVNQQTVSEEKLLNSGSATAEMLHFLTACIRYGVSVCIAGSTGSGKTTIMAWLLSNVPNNRRLITIEEGSREFDLVKRDAQGNILNSVVHLLTRPSENPALNINQDFLLERVLRKHPDVIGVGEMRSAAESLSAAESSRTGHTVCTTIHSNSCNSTYRRMMTLAKRKYNMDDSILMQIMVEAYPIIVFTKQLEDRSRKIMEIIEGEDYQDGRLIAHSLYKYEVEDNVTDNRGKTHVVGHHKKIGLISDSLKKRLLDNGISNKELEEFMQPPKEVGSLQWIDLICFILLSAGLLALFGVKPGDFIDALFRSQRKSATLSDELNVLLGTPAKGFFNQDYELKQILKGTGRADRYEAVKRLSLILFAVGAVLALLIGNVYMVPILGIGFSLIPIWYLRSTAASYKKHLNEELETAISIITTSYLRTEDLIRSVKENLPYINEPVKANFEAFVYEAELINANITSAINSLKMKIPNRVFHEWCGTLIQCQSDRSMKNTLPTINQKFSDVRVVQSELEAMMQGPRREAITMIFLVIANVPLLYFLNEDWFHTLIFTTPGKIALAICAAIILFALTQIMKLSKPIEYGGDSV